MKCPNQLCQRDIEGKPENCPRCAIPLPGNILAERFALEQIHRSTPYLINFLAFDRQREEELQVRVFIPRFGRSIATLRSEIKALQELRFDQLPRIYQFDWDADFPWIAEERNIGTPVVNRLVGHEQPCSETEVIRILLDAARILEKLHTLHIYHRDLRPESLIWRERDQRWLLGSPGWERELQDRTSAKARVIYAAPEYVAGRATPQADLYSLGVVAIHLLTGLNPEGLFQPATRQFNWQRAVKVSPRLAEIIDMLVVESPSERIQTASRLAQLLAALSQPESPATEKNSEPTVPVTGDETAKVNLPGKNIPVAIKAASKFRDEREATLGGLAPLKEFAATAATKTDQPRFKKWLALSGAALVAIASVILSLVKRYLPGQLAHISALHGIKVLVAIGLIASAGFALNKILRRQLPYPTLPPPLRGVDDQAIPVTPDIGEIAHQQLPALSGKYSARTMPRSAEQLAAKTPEISIANYLEKLLLANQAPSLPGNDFAFTLGAGPNMTKVTSWYGSFLPPQQNHSVTPGKISHPELSLLSDFRKSLAAFGWPTSLEHFQPTAPGRLANQSVDGSPVPAMLAAPDSAAPSDSAATANATVPYDEIAEPGTAPNDASGLSKQISPYFIRVNKTYHTLTLYREGRYLAQFPITIGTGSSTPDGRFVIRNKVQRPPYGDIPGGDPRNPLGTHWLGIGVSYPGGKSLGLHGTRSPDNMGLNESGGCIRLRNADIKQLYELIPAGTPIEIL
ncbi:MAG: L,D-transpeptidase family protein [Cyanobacteria bacterium NC_groundwater_1444_Ag_S-0.65um_54_12]|nr:L,D-transpeptidase family protein [Cyanobacteria bacterium NC_groundwater_1444_Ag_S-0.65um_54_12]